jgi:small redox-active disulfide protein 2
MPTISVLGSGCANCNRLTALTEQALAELGVAAEVEKVTDVAEIAAAGVMATPALVVDGEVLMAGRIPGLAALERELAARLGSV